MTSMDLEAIIARSVEVHTWRPASLAREIATLCEREGTPFCWECADWHNPAEEHSETWAEPAPCDQE